MTVFSSVNNKEVSCHISTVIQTILAGLFIFVSYLAFGRVASVTLLSWHVFLTGAAILFFIPWSILNISDISIISKHLSRDTKNSLHGLLAFLGVGFGLAGFICIIVYKQNNNVSHFETSHSIVGLTTVILLALVSVGGILLKWSNLISPRILKICHPVLGVCALILGLATECLGFDKVWFVLISSNAARDACISLSAISMFWVIVRPLINTFDRVNG